MTELILQAAIAAIAMAVLIAASYVIRRKKQ